MIPISFARNIFITTLLIFVTVLLVSLATISADARIGYKNADTKQRSVTMRLLSVLELPLNQKILQEQLMTGINKYFPADELAKDSPETGGFERFFVLYVPENTAGLELIATGGGDDIDLYAKHRALPTASNYDCRSVNQGARHRCSIQYPRRGTYYVMLRGNASYRGISITGAYRPAGPMFATTPAAETSGAHTRAPNI